MTSLIGKTLAQTAPASAEPYQPAALANDVRRQRPFQAPQSVEDVAVEVRDA